MEGVSFDMGAGSIVMVEIKSKNGVVSKAPYDLYMTFVDMRNFIQFLPEEKKEGVTADFDSIHADVQGFNIGMKVVARVPYSRIEYQDDGAPFEFSLSLHFDPAQDPYKTDFHIVLDADLNFMMKTILGSKLQESLDKIVDAMVDMSEGRMPEGFDPSMMQS